jgi:hypothetical protein
MRRDANSIDYRKILPAIVLARSRGLLPSGGED